MMEENNRKGPGIFYAVVGVATLVVAIIGATFAYFSATVDSSATPITGETIDLSTEALSVKAEKVSFDGAKAANPGLVPADMDDISTNLAKSVDGALKAKCEDANGNYTGCHVWRITVNSKQAVTAASVELALSVDTTSNDNWSYAVFTGEESLNETKTTGFTNVAMLASTPNAIGKIGTATAPLKLELNQGLGLSAGTVEGTPSKVVYLMVYLANTDNPQNNASDVENGGTDETATYTGTVTLNAAGEGGEVKATFTATA